MTLQMIHTYTHYLAEQLQKHGGWTHALAIYAAMQRHINLWLLDVVDQD